MKTKPPKKQSIPARKNTKKVKVQVLPSSSFHSSSSSSPLSLGASSILSFLSRLLPPYLKDKTEEKKRPGFTLIELMVVMAIISILATAGLSAYTGYLKGARDSKRASIAREMRTIVESLTTITGAPTPEELDAYLVAEGLAWSVPIEDPLLARIGQSLIGVVGIPSAWALIEDPVGGKPVCLNHTGNAVMVCQFVYYQFSDGTYAISYGVEKEKNLVNPHYSGKVTPMTYGSFIGNSPAITITPTTSTTNIEAETNALWAVGITASETLVGAISTVEGGSRNGEGSNCATAGDVCPDGTVYVSASLRTTPSNRSGGIPWKYGYVTSGATSLTNGADNTGRLVTLGGYFAADSCNSLGFGGYNDWYVPAKEELNTLYNNKDAIGGFGASWYWSSTEYDYHDVWRQEFNSGAQGHDPKDYSRALRCVRTPTP